MTDAAGVSRILTLVFTDLADSTALKTQRGDQVIGELIARHRANVQRVAAEAGGRVVSWAGDGGFLIFETPSTAVLFALRLQQAHADEPDLPGVRTGIHMGEVSERRGADGDVEGLAVDLAARICGLAGPAQVLMSASVADSARPRLDRGAFGRPIRWQTHGRYALKGFDEPLEIREVGIEGVAPFVAPAASDKATPARSTAPRRRALPVAIVAIVLGAAAAYLLRSPTPDRPAVARPTGPPSAGPDHQGPDAAPVPAFAGRPAIAVLPLDNLSPDPAQAFFADGLAEDLITRLSAWRAFPVIARNSSFQYRGGNLDLKRVGAELGARYLVEGSVRRAGDQIRITAQLIDTSSGEHVWAQTYDREVKDVFALQDEISGTIAATIASDVSRVEAERARQRGTENLEAWSFYQLGVQRLDRLTPEDSAEAQRLFERAVALDPRFASALAQLSQAEVGDHPGLERRSGAEAVRRAHRRPPCGRARRAGSRRPRRARRGLRPDWRRAERARRGPTRRGLEPEHAGGVELARVGDTVNIASRLESNGEADRINISQSTYEHIRDRFECEYRGKLPVKNAGDIDMYFVTRPKPAEG